MIYEGQSNNSENEFILFHPVDEQQRNYVVRRTGHMGLTQKTVSTYMHTPDSNASMKQEWLAVTCGKMEPIRDEQFATLKFCTRLQKSATDVYKMLQQA